MHHEKRNLQIGDIVIITDNNYPRGQWKMGKINNVQAEIDGKVRLVSIQDKNKDSDIYPITPLKGAHHLRPHAHLSW